MTDNSSPSPPLNTFVVRFWRDRSAAGARWRGTVEHVQTGTRAAFLDLAGLTTFIHRLGIMILTSGEDQSDKNEGC
jgi:hypothetical protein